MTTKFCYRCAIDTEFISGGKRCSRCGLTWLQGKKFANSEKKSTQRPSANSKKVQVVEKASKQFENVREKSSQSLSAKAKTIQIDTKILFCYACNKATHHDFQSNGNLWCNTCGRDEAAAISFAKLTKSENGKNESYVDSTLVTSIKLTLLVTLFPWSLLFLVIFYGFSRTAEIVKSLLSDVFLAAIPIIFVSIIIVFVLLVVNNKI